MYRAKNGSLPEKLKEHLCLLNEKHVYMTRSNENKICYCQYSNSKLKSFRISIVGVKLWNNYIGVTLKGSISLTVFKRLLKKYFIDHYIKIVY